MNNWSRLLGKIFLWLAITTGVVIIGRNLYTGLTETGFFSSQTLRAITVIQFVWIIGISLFRKMPMAPIRMTLLTLSLYLLVGQLTYEWAGRLLPLFGLNQILNFVILGLFVRAFLHAPSGEVKKAEIGRVEFVGSPLPLGLNVVIAQGGATTPHFFGWEPLNRRLPLFAVFSVKLKDGVEGLISLSAWFNVTDPSKLDEYDLQRQVVPRLQRIFEGDVRNWASELTSKQFSNQEAIIAPDGKNVSSIQSLEKEVIPVIEDAGSVLTDYGLEFDDLIVSDPKLSKTQDKTTALRGQMDILMANNGLSEEKALNTALVLSGDAQLVMLGLGGRGKGGGGNVIADVDEQGGGKGKGGKGDKEEKKDEKKLSDPPKAKKGGYKIILVLWTILAFVSFNGWGKTQTTAGITPSQVSDVAVVVAEKLNPNNLLPKRLNQPALDIPLVDNLKKTWIVSTGMDKYGNRISDDEGWIRNDTPGYLRAHVELLDFWDKSAPSNQVLVEAELESGEIQTFSTDENGRWHMHLGDTKRPVHYLTLLKNSVRFRIKVLDPHPKHPLAFTIRRSK